uniref:AlNc14C22G2241 protein n=1 Tax=Albugo laibachii Nc14 TaxID=890382 RepID=F0W5S6_9STRA|nr:AlNc14C22G2241 [Albugo laibachii Nc14]|eukprot:CCA16467.1 AlNc14C22G2241 [Albugo laibachii Nc14]
MREGLELKLEPVGFTKAPSSDLELIAALICVARALIGLHALGCVHRDIRWPNILCRGHNAYFLIDFGSAGYDGESVPEAFLDSKALDPYVGLDTERVYRSCHDMYQFGKLIKDTKDESLLGLRMNLLRAEAAKRYNVKEVLDILIMLQTRPSTDSG